MIRELFQRARPITAVLASADDPAADLDAIRALVGLNALGAVHAAQAGELPDLGDAVWRELVNETGGASAYQQMIADLDTAERDFQSALRWAGTLYIEQVAS